MLGRLEGLSKVAGYSFAVACWNLTRTGSIWSSIGGVGMSLLDSKSPLKRLKKNHVLSSKQLGVPTFL